MARIDELIIAVGKTAQPDLATANVQGDLMRVTKQNADFASVELVTETDEGEIGKGSEWASAVYKSHWNVSASIEKLLSSEFLGWAFAYAMGNCVVAPDGAGFKHTLTPLNPFDCTGNELPAFTFVEGVRQDQACEVLDRALVGCMINDLSLSIAAGPGRQNARLRVGIIGTGKQGTVVLPAVKTPEHALLASSATITLNGVDYVTTKNLVSMEFTLNNNIAADEGFYIGSGVQDGAAIRGRMEIGKRELGFNVVARFENGSTELTKLRDLTEGGLALTLTGDTIADAVKHKFALSAPRVVFSSATLGTSGSTVTVQVSVKFLEDVNGDVISAEVTNTVPLLANEV
jgi:hypothetical protein